MKATLTDDFGQRWVNSMFETLLVRSATLADLDRRSGDGDFGNNITSALRRAQLAVEQRHPHNYGEWVTAVSRGFLGTGGTSGPLFGMFFRELSRCTIDPSPTLAEFSHGLAAGVATVQRYGKAEVGHKTMIDALLPAADALANLVANDAEPSDALARTAAVAIAGAQKTADFVAQRGRASYVGEVARGVVDPGAAAAAIVLQTAAAAQTASTVPVDTNWLIN
nr:DAK2 domain-containing protein [Rhodococcus wratislaviensis]GLK35106.1 dihydroxyacetone kinase [Rhodococcus wratislaviensis]